ncbi:MAG: hypothetical protein Q8K62_14740 [Thiobacillus sp.]|nr:hypothetical protein [Thiobacillus sp.]
MNFVVRLLIVEDDEPETASWKNAIEMHNSEHEAHGFEIDASYAKSLTDALGLIAGRDFDAAVVDIRLEQQGMVAPNTDGNKVVERLLDSELAVVAVFTGEIPEVSIPAWAKKLVQPFRKGGDEGEGTPAVMEWLRKQVPMIKSIRQAQLTIKKEMVELFTRSIWPRWSNWIEQGEGAPEYLEAALSRHLASHIHATLLEGANQMAHPEEWYFIPPIRDGIRTGDLINCPGAVFEIVVTPRCDLAIANKVETIQLAECRIVTEEWEGFCNAIKLAKGELGLNQDPNKNVQLQKKVETAKANLRKYTQHAGSKASFHFLPAMKLHDGTTLGPFMVQFDKIRSVRNTALGEIAAIRGNRVASLTPEFLPSLVERLGGFFSRIGTPDYSHPN